MATKNTLEIQKLAHNILVDSFGAIWDHIGDEENIKRLIELGAVRVSYAESICPMYYVIDEFEMYFDALGI